MSFLDDVRKVLEFVRDVEEVPGSVLLDYFVEGAGICESRDEASDVIDELVDENLIDRRNGSFLFTKEASRFLDDEREWCKLESTSDVQSEDEGGMPSSRTTSLIPEPKVCPKKIYGVNWYEQLEEPNRENIEGAKELIKFMDTYWTYQMKDEEEKREEFRKTVEEQNKLSLERNSDFLEKMSPNVPLYYDPDIDYENIQPSLKFVDSKRDRNMWEYFRHIVSSVPHRGTVGKNLRFFLWDETSDTVLGIGGLGSPALALKPREEYFGIDEQGFYRRFREETGLSCREFNPNCHTIVPLQPFGMFAGGKLITMLIATDEMMVAWKDKYERRPWGFHTTSMYGKSIQYDRLYDWDLAGMTKGHGSVHYSGVNMDRVIDYLDQFSYIDRKRTDISKGGSQVGLARIREVARVFFGGELKEDKALHYHGISRGIYCAGVFENLNLWDWYNQEGLKIDRTVHKYPNDESISHKQIDSVQNKFDFWKDRWFKRRYAKHSDKIDDCSIEDYQYVCDVKQKTLIDGGGWCE